MVRLKDVAYQAGYDISTVSKVLQGGNIHVSAEARERITKAAAELGYRPNLMARGLRTRKAGAVVLGFPCLDHPMYPAITEGAEQAATELGLALFAYKFPPEGAANALLDLVRQGRADGIILASEVPDCDFVKLAIESRVPVITLNEYSTDPTLSVVLDDAAGFALQATYLAGLGHTRIAYVGVHPESTGSRSCEESFKESLRKQGVLIDPSYIFGGSFGGDNASEVVDHILKLEQRPTAIATASLTMGTRIIRELSTRGVDVPNQINVIGYHDSKQAEWTTPSVTTVRMPSVVQGRCAVERLFAVLNSQKSLAAEVISEPIEVVERESCCLLSEMNLPHLPND